MIYLLLGFAMLYVLTVAGMLTRIWSWKDTALTREDALNEAVYYWTQADDAFDRLYDEHRELAEKYLSVPALAELFAAALVDHINPTAPEGYQSFPTEVSKRISLEARNWLGERGKNPRDVLRAAQGKGPAGIPGAVGIIGVSV